MFASSETPQFLLSRVGVVVRLIVLGTLGTAVQRRVLSGMRKLFRLLLSE